jgi:hypothetical protein
MTKAGYLTRSEKDHNELKVEIEEAPLFYKESKK